LQALFFGFERIIFRQGMLEPRQRRLGA